MIFVNDVPSSFEDTELSEDAIADDVYNMSVLLERTLSAYKKVSSSLAAGNTKNESVQTLISVSLVEMMDDIRESLGMTKESASTQKNETDADFVAGKRVTEHVDADVEGDDEECDADSSNSYATASTTLRDHSNRIECKSPESTNLLAPLSPAASSQSKSALADLISDDSAQVLLEKYSDILVKMVQDKLSTKTNAIDKNLISSKSATLAQPKNNEKSFGSLRSKTKTGGGMNRTKSTK